MMQRLKGFLAALPMAMVLCGGVPALAHHSGAMFDRTKTVELVGTIKEYQFSNPHVWIEVLVPPAGQGKAQGKKAAADPVQWSVEGEGPSIMARIGLGPSVLKAGDKVTIKLHPLRDGRSGGSLISITLADGRVLPPPRAP
jgi:hypothetical protein